jgi:D-glycero-alpha-D-manno-heptose-7-phosphate kinase
MDKWIITKTPNRISFFGGGTDYPEFYTKYPSFVISTAIDKFSYFMIRKMPNFFDYKTRVVYSHVEEVKDNEEIQHKIVNKVLEVLQIKDGLEIIHTSSLPGNSGVGSSSTFTSGLFHGLSSIQGQIVSPRGLAEATILLERDILKETVGIQDAYAAAYGGFNKIAYSQHGITVSPIICSTGFIQELEDSCLLIYTKIKRKSSEIANDCFKQHNPEEQRLITRQIAEEGYQAIRAEDIHQIGRLVDKSWEVKRSLSSLVSNPIIDDIYKRAKSLGCYGKVIGAGGGGCMLLIFDKSLKYKVRQEFKEFVAIDFKMCFEGSKVMYVER